MDRRPRRNALSGGLSKVLVALGGLGRLAGDAFARQGGFPALVPRRKDDLLRFGAFVVLGGIAGYFFAPGKTELALAPSAPVPEVWLEGQRLPQGAPVEKSLDAAAAIARAYVKAPVTLKLPGGATLSKTREELGIRVDGAHLEVRIRELYDARSALRRAHAELGGGALKVPLPAVVDEKRAVSALLQIKDDVDAPPSNARLDFAARAVTPEKTGKRFDVYGTLSRLDQAVAKGEKEVSAMVEELPAARGAKELETLQYDDVLGYFETKYARDLKHEARTFNLRNAAKKLDGYVLFPGETFDFNQVVGPRDEAHGYKVATVIASGELVDGIGGGTCQVAGTLHGAAYFSGLEIVERKPHTRPSFYIKMGMDATVVYPTITMKLRNPFPYPVVIREMVEQGVVRAEILGPKRTRDVTFVRKVNDVVPFKEKEANDPNIPKGERVLAQRGIPGFKITRYRIVREGPFAVRERTMDVYPPTNQIWKIGTGDPDPKFESHDDEHPEYVADEYLVVSQGPSVISLRAKKDERGGPMVESRVAGKYGTHGWTVREGFAKSVSGTGKGKKKSDSDDNPGVD